MRYESLSPGLMQYGLGWAASEAVAVESGHCEAPRSQRHLDAGAIYQKRVIEQNEKPRNDHNVPDT